MPDPTVPTTVIDRFREAQVAYANARRTIVLTAILVVVVYIAVIITTINNFRTNQIDQFAGVLSEEMSAYLPEAGERVKLLVDRVVPVYSEVLARTFERDQEKYLTVLSDEFQALELYVQESTPRMQEAIAQLVVDQEMAAGEALEKLVPRSELTAASNHYHEALQAKMQEVLTTYFAEHISTSERILRKLNQMASLETEEIPEGGRYTIGMILELLGLEMQENATEGEALVPTL